MLNKEELFERINAGLTYYSILETNYAMGEDGKYVSEESNMVGYAVVNKLTNVVEHTSTILPGVLFQAQHFDNTLASLTADEMDIEVELESQDDVVLQ